MRPLNPMKKDRNLPHPHVETLDRRFMLSQTEVTQELWESVMGNDPVEECKICGCKAWHGYYFGVANCDHNFEKQPNNPSRFKHPSRPVENVSWIDAQIFVAILNGMKDELGVPYGYEFTLPREAEWEHACRAAPTNAFWEKLDYRTMTPFHFGETLDSKQANIGKSLGGTSVVGIYPANPWGLHDMHGNVQEWCWDGLGFGPLTVQGRTSQEEGFYRSLRGGSWSLSAEQSRSAYRNSGNPIRPYPHEYVYDPTRPHDPPRPRDGIRDDVGFRLALAAVK